MMTDDLLTHTFTLPSGVSCTVTEMDGTHQRLLTSGKFKNDRMRGFNEMLRISIARLGEQSATEITEQTIRNLYSGDRAKILVELRQFTMGFDPTFSFDYEWGQQGGKRQKQFYTFEFTPDDFPTTPYYWVREKYEAAIAEAELVHERRGVEFTDLARAQVPVPELYSSYAQVRAFAEYDVVLPRSKKTVRVQVLDGQKESQLSQVPPEEQSAHTFIALRNPRYVEQEDGKERLFAVNLDKLKYLDLQFLRHEITQREGSVDTFLVIQNKQDTALERKINLIALPDFFFPSPTTQLT